MDDDAARAISALALEFAGFRVMAVPSITEARRRPPTVRPRLVVADLRDGRPEDWASLENFCETSAASARLVLVADAGEEIPPVLARHAAAIIRRPVDPATLVKMALDLSDEA